MAFNCIVNAIKVTQNKFNKYSLHDYIQWHKSNKLDSRCYIFDMKLTAIECRDTLFFISKIYLV